MGPSGDESEGGYYEVQFRDFPFLNAEVAATGTDEAYELGRQRLVQYFLYYPAQIPVPMLPDDADIDAILRHRDQLLDQAEEETLGLEDSLLCEYTDRLAKSRSPKEDRVIVQFFRSDPRTANIPNFHELLQVHLMIKRSLRESLRIIRRAIGTRAFEVIKAWQLDALTRALLLEESGERRELPTFDTQLEMLRGEFFSTAGRRIGRSVDRETDVAIRTKLLAIRRFKSLDGRDQLVDALITARAVMRKVSAHCFFGS